MHDETETETETPPGEPATEPEEEPLPNRVELVGTRGPLVCRIVPPRLDVRYRFVRALPRVDYDLLGSAALWFCCGPVRKQVGSVSGAKLADIGSAVDAWLVEQGVPHWEGYQAGQAALRHCIQDLPDQEAARTAAGFSAPTRVASRT